MKHINFIITLLITITHINLVIISLRIESNPVWVNIINILGIIFWVLITYSNFIDLIDSRIKEAIAEKEELDSWHGITNDI